VIVRRKSGKRLKIVTVLFKKQSNEKLMQSLRKKRKSKRRSQERFNEGKNQLSSSIYLQKNVFLERDMTDSSLKSLQKRLKKLQKLMKSQII